MHIRKLKHCCMIIETGKRRIMTDPGFYSVEEHEKAMHIDVMLITHEHADHFHIESLKAMVKRMPEMTVITNDAVGEILAKEGIKHTVMKNDESITIKDVKLEAIGKDHAVIYKTIPIVSNIGYLIDNKLFYPGDALTDPKRSVDALALPVAGPWLKISDAIDYALKVNPKLAFPVHDGTRGAVQHIIPEKILSENGIRFIKLEEGGELNIP